MLHKSSTLQSYPFLLVSYSVLQIDSVADIFSPPSLSAFQHTQKASKTIESLCGELFRSKILSDEKSSVPCCPQGWPGCQSVLGHKRLRSQHCPFSACHMSTVTHSLCVWRIDSHLRMPLGALWQSEEKFGLIGELPHRSMSDQNTACFFQCSLFSS